MLAPWKKSYDKLIQHIKKQSKYFSTKSFANKFPYGQSYGFSNSYVWMWEVDHKEGWAPKNWYFSTVVLEKTLKSPLDNKEIKPVNPKGNQFWIFIGRTWSYNTLATCCEELTCWKRPWFWERLKVGGEGDDREWHNCMVMSLSKFCE